MEVLKLLQESYLGKVKMIYIDPPYNTGNDFIYRDDFKQTAAEYDEESGVFDEDENRLFKNTDSNGRFHSDWCSMIYPRLMLARNLLSDDGVIFISIDDNEQENLKQMCNEVFGKSNFIAHCCVQKSTNGMGDKKGFAKNHEFILCYQKTDLTLFRGLTPSSEYIASFDREDEYGKYKIDGILMKKGADSRRDDSPTLYFPLYYNNVTGDVSLDEKEGYFKRYPIKSDGTDGRWTWGKDKIRKDGYRLLASPAGTIYIKDYYTGIRRMKIKTILNNVLYLTDRATNEIKNLLGGKVFDTPKPMILLEDLCDISLDKDDIVLDFFSGSATTAHAVMQLNAEDGGNRKFIMVQLPEPCDEKSEAYKAGYKNICEIGKERIRRAGDKIKAETGADIDYGFRVFKVDDSNMNDIYYSVAELSQTTLASTLDNIKPDRSALDLLFGCLLDWGLPLSMPYKSEQLGGCTVHTYNEGDLLACFDMDIPEEVLVELAKRQPLRAVFRDSCFADSPAKINVFEIFKLYAPDCTVKVL